MQKDGICLRCGSGILPSGKHVREDLRPCYGEELETAKEYKSLDELAADFPNGTSLRHAQRDGTNSSILQVQGVTWSLPKERGGRDEPALVVRTKYGIGAVYPSEITMYRTPRGELVHLDGRA